LGGRRRFHQELPFLHGNVWRLEQKRRAPDAGSATMLKMIRADPNGVEQIIAKLK